MYVVLFIVAALELIAGLLVFVGSQSAIHEILGALLGGFAFMTLGLAAILAELQSKGP